ncbi:uncharacterized protein LOC126817765 [Patella vulgata]|uniref:uncharacterized protein LOC126817765 n=1 Tax=Patella vulgata TaxID=6465 RepID=UPI00217F4E6A|nr:uncharacterized protein LOC126817765 [Patella vulgata]
MEGLGDKEDQQTNDIYIVTQKARTLGRLVLEAKKINKNGIINMDSLLKPENFDLVVKCAKRMSHERDVLSLGRFLGNLLGHIIQVKIGQSFRDNNEVKIKEASGFQKLYESEWNNRVNSVCLKKHNILNRKQLQTIPITEDLKTFRQFITDNMKSAKDSLNTDRTFENWNRLSKLTLCRLILFNKRRRAEVIELKVDDYEKRPKWNEDTNQEIMLSLSKTDQILSRRMDMMISGGKSRKNVDAYVLFPPDCKQSADLMMATRAEAGIRHSNPYLFARHYSDTPLSGNLEMRELAESFPGLKYPERINSRLLRKYTATVSQLQP